MAMHSNPNFIAILCILSAMQHANRLKCIKTEVLACMHVNLISYRDQIDKYTETS